MTLEDVVKKEQEIIDKLQILIFIGGIISGLFIGIAFECFYSLNEIIRLLRMKNG